MSPRPVSERKKPCRRLEGKTALITGGDSGIGWAVAYGFAKEGADVVIVYYNEDRDAVETEERLKQIGCRYLMLQGDLKDPDFSACCVQRTIECFGKLDILVNNHVVQFIKRSILDISHEQLTLIFENHVFSFFYMIQAALPYMKRGGSIINTTSVTAYQGNKDLIDYSETKGIRVNVVAPGPIWTPLIPSSYSAEEVQTFGFGTSKVPMLRAGQSCEVSPCYVFLASDDASYMTGQVLHPNGGTVVGA